MKNNTEAKSLKKQLQSHYVQQHLTCEQLLRLQRLQETTPIATSKPNAPIKVMGAIAASAVLTVTGYLFLLTDQDYNSISKQIAYNHNSKMQMEVFSPELQTVQGHLNKLGFNLVSSSKINKDKWQLIGGRYCNINGKIAAQLKLRHSETKAIYTFYQAKVAGDVIDNLNGDETAVDGVKIKLWREKGLLMGLAF
ncbi:MAG: hypothetical protein ACI9ES_001007 [Oceanospirillaceae bacterium]|jgi:hypothetical protein